MSDKKGGSNKDSIADVGEKITVRSSDGELKEVREVVNVRRGDEIQEGTFIIETREVKD